MKEQEVEPHRMVFVARACKLEVSKLAEHHKMRLELVERHRMQLVEVNKLEVAEEVGEQEQAEEVDKLARLEVEVVEDMKA